jgi:hypothetical protein
MSWTQANNGLLSPPVMSPAIDPVTPTTLYAGTANSGVFKSTNGGNSWNAINSGLKISAVQVLAVDPVTPSTIYAGMYYGGVYVNSQQTLRPNR